jgi:hypothetical protein
MSTNHKPSDIVETTDCLEAIGICRGWKNLSFIFLIIGLVVVQLLFWMVDLGLVKMETRAIPMDPTSIADTNAAPARPQKTSELSGSFGLTFGDVQRLLAITNGVVLLSALLFCLSLLISTLISVVGRLGGLHHICRAFFLSVVTLVLLVPWQGLGSCALGAIYTPSELSRWTSLAYPGSGQLFVYYLRFVGYWLIVFVMPIVAHYRTTRWARSILRRLEII